MALALAPQPASACTRVLIVDDNEEDLKQWSRALTSSSSNYAVLQSSSAQSALALCQENNVVDCVLLDLDMPVSGFHALLELVPDRTRPRVAVIILTHLNHPNLFEMAKHNGAQACLLKQGISAKDLDTAIQQAIAAVKSKQEDAGGG